MRLLLFLLGLALGVAGTLAYAMFQAPAPVPAPAPLPPDPQISVTLGERFLTEIVRRAQVSAPGVSNLRVELHDDTIVVRGDVDVLGQHGDATATLRPEVRGEKLRLAVVETSVGAMPVPAFADALEGAVNSRLRSMLDGIPVAITGATVEHHGFTVTCRVDTGALDRRIAR